MNALYVLKGRSDVGIFPDSQLSVVKVEIAGSAYLDIEIVARVGHCDRAIQNYS